jgi:hypothetical protein
MVSPERAYSPALSGGVEGQSVSGHNVVRRTALLCRPAADSQPILSEGNLPRSCYHGGIALRAQLTTSRSGSGFLIKGVIPQEYGQL